MHDGCREKRQRLGKMIHSGNDRTQIENHHVQFGSLETNPVRSLRGQTVGIQNTSSLYNNI